MIDPVSFLALLLATVGASHLVAPRNRFVRLFWITLAGMTLLFITHQRALVLAFASMAVSSMVYFGGRAADDDRIRARIPYLILLVLLLPDWLSLYDESPILYLGSAFFVVRQMMTVAQSLKKSVPLSTFAPALTMATFFVAALPSGPVFNGIATWEQLEMSRPSDNAEGLYRLLEGFVYLFALGGLATFALRIFDLAAELGDGLASLLLLQVIFVPLAGFAVLFTTFYGYSRMAEGSALLLGFTVPQNFNRPHLASDLADYWKRWHRSMADFVMQYIYLPVLVTTRRAKLALVAAFVFMGLWHNLSLPFMIWGVGHGVGLGVVMPWMKRRGTSPMVIRVWSLIFVLMLSGIAHGVWR